MNTSSNGMFAVIIVVLLIALGLYFVLGTGSTVVMTPVATSTVPVVTATPNNQPTSTPGTVYSTTTTTTSTASNTPFILTMAQKEALVKFGISSSSIPATVSVAQEACFVAKLGVPRVMEIKAGSVPTMAEFLKAKSCL